MKRNRSFLIIVALFFAFSALTVTLVFADGDNPALEILADSQSVEVPVAPVGRPPIGGLCTGGTPVQVSVYSDTLESGDGGWVASGAGDWEYGAIVTGGAGCDSTPTTEPTAAHSGSNVWATNLSGCYANSGSTSVLSQTFDLSSYSSNIEMGWYHWYHVFEQFDEAILFVNGDLLWETPNSNPTADWTFQSVDLTPYAGLAAVTVEWHLNATTVVNRLGWYIDDIYVDACRAPTDVSLTSFDGEGDGTLYLALLMLLVPISLGGAVFYQKRRAMAGPGQ